MKKKAERGKAGSGWFKCGENGHFASECAVGGIGVEKKREENIEGQEKTKFGLKMKRFLNRAPLKFLLFRKIITPVCTQYICNFM